METHKRFKVQFSYLVKDLNFKLSADVELHHSEPHYLVTNINGANRSSEIPLLPDITIKAILTETGLKWIHTDSEVETILSILVGCEIEKTSLLEIS